MLICADYKSHRIAFAGTHVRTIIQIIESEVIFGRRGNHPVGVFTSGDSRLPSDVKLSSTPIYY